MTNQKIFLDRRGFIGLFLVAHLVFWLFQGLSVQAFTPLHGDMLEAYFWGQNFELGYYKHPPFWAWIAGLWFYIWPTQNWAFLLLCSINTTIGLAGIFAVISRFCDGLRRELAFLLLFLTPLYTFTIFQFNANTIFISIWPWTIFFLLKSLETRRLSYAISFGLCGAMLLLSKYTAIFMLISCLIAAFFHSQARSYFRSPAPWISILIAASLCVPHLYWLMAHEYMPLQYVEGKLNNSLAFTLRKMFDFVTSFLLQHIVILTLIVFVKWKTGQKNDTAQNSHDAIRNRTSLFILAYLPIILPFVSGALASIKLSVNMAQAFAFLIPLTLILSLTTDQMNRLLQWVRSGILIILFLTTIASPFIAFFILKSQKGQMNEPWIEAARQASLVWSQETKAPLKIATGTSGYSAALSFYADGNPRQWTDQSFKTSPWITVAEICHSGVLAVCLSDDENCIQNFRNLAPDRITTFDARVRRQYWGITGPERSISILILPPQSCPLNFKDGAGSN